MKRNYFFTPFWAGVLCLSLLAGCSKKDDDELNFGRITGTVLDQAATPLEGVTIMIFNASTHEALNTTLTTSSDGTYALQLETGIYYLKFFKQGYQAVPPKAIPPVVFDVVLGKDFEYSIALNPSGEINAGWISGTVKSDNKGLSGALVVATNGDKAYSAISSQDGSFTIYNVPAGNFELKGWRANYNGNTEDVSVISNSETASVHLSMSSEPTGQVTGQISFLATENTEVDVALVHPLTQEIIPGLSTTTSGGKYKFEQVPAGKYLARATYMNDTKVLDPDWIIKFGQPYLTVTDQAIEKDFSVTGAISIQNPAVFTPQIQPVRVTSTDPSFSWHPYSSASNYIIEVSDLNGEVIWGGFSHDWTMKNIVLSKNTTSVSFNSDGKASKALEDGKIYRWRVFASKDDAKEATGWKLISVSEDQKGLFKIDLD
ncbi:MAG: MSCRAMM family protein [Candidatus Cyclobacteriaceae bacterium M3_2C_046]